MRVGEMEADLFDVTEVINGSRKLEMWERRALMRRVIEAEGDYTAEEMKKMSDVELASICQAVEWERKHLGR